MPPKPRNGTAVLPKERNAQARARDKARRLAIPRALAAKTKQESDAILLETLNPETQK